MIQVDRLVKRYGNFVAVNEISFSLAPGDICGLVGHNGAGKTTTLKCLAGLMKATSGEIVVAGRSPLRDLVAVKRSVIYVPDDPPLFDDLTVADHFEFMGRIYDIADYRERADALLAQFGLLERRRHYAHALSRGMRQKVAICLAYLVEPSVMLFDEPLTGLDPPGIRLFLDTLQQQSRRGTTIVLSSHLLAMIEDVCTQVMVMDHGQVRFIGSKSGLRAAFPNTQTLEQAFFAAIDPQTHASAPDGNTPTSGVAHSFDCQASGQTTF